MLRRTVVARTAILTVLALAACSGDDLTGHDRNGSQPNIVFISIDTLRADHVRCYGHPSARTPHIDRLAAEGTRFEVCISSCPMTLPSHATMMTGTYPFVHGARNNGTFVLDGENLTLAEVLRDAGYATHAEIGAAVLEAEAGLAQGFDGYGDSFIDAQVAASTVQDDLITQRSAETVTDAALAYLESRRGRERPFFLFVHYYDPHQPYQAPAPYSNDEENGYLAEIEYTDAQLGRLLDALRGPDLAGRTLAVLTSDHGDGLADHREFTHGVFLYDTTLRVPLVLWSPGQIAAGQVARAQVGLVDLLPTLLDLVGLQPPEQIQGKSLVPLLEDPQGQLALTTYSETLEPRIAFGYSELRSLRRDGWKYIHGPRPELYKVEQDPKEHTDRVLQNPGQAETMRAAMRDLIAGSPPLLGRGAARELDAQDTQRLAALGYASAEGPEEEDDPHLWTDELVHFNEPRGANPMDKARDIYLLYSGMAAMQERNYEAGVENWSLYVERNPEYAAGHSYLAQCHAALGHKLEAIAPLRRALELDPQRCDDYQILGSMLAETDQRAEARKQFARALECNPEHLLAALNLGKVLILLTEHADAISILDDLITRAPGIAKAHSLRARALRAQGLEEDALTSLRTAVELQNTDAPTRLELASLLQHTGLIDEARDVHDESLRILPRNASIRAAAARFWIDRGEGARALELLDAGLRQQPQSVSLSVLRVRLLATDSDPAVRDGERAQRLAQALLKGGHGEDPRVLAAAAAAAAEQGDLENAIDLAQQAMAHARERDAEGLAERLEAELATYRAQGSSGDR